MRPELTLMIPAYNEASRLPAYLARVREYGDRVFPGGYEVIVVDDGSEDGLAGILEELTADWPQLSFRRHLANQGKGAAVRTGVLAAAGEFVLFTDADGATPIAEECKLRRAIEQGADIAVGSRLLGDRTTRQERRWYRALGGRVFARLANWLVPLPVRDTQCGFKMFRREVGQHLFQACDEPGYLFDVVILAAAQRLGCRVAEVPVSWTDVPGSKVRLRGDGWAMLRGLWRLRRRFYRVTNRNARSCGHQATAVGPRDAHREPAKKNGIPVNPH